MTTYTLALTEHEFIRLRARHSQPCTCGHTIETGEMAGYNPKWTPTLRCATCAQAIAIQHGLEARENETYFLKRKDEQCQPR